MKKQIGEITVGLLSVAATALVGLLASGTIKVPEANFDAACKAQFVQQKGTNYGYDSVEHCLKNNK